MDDTGFWILDEDDQKVYRYDRNGQEQANRSFNVTTPDDDDHLEGITSDGTSIWILDNEEGVFEYDLAGNYLGRSFELNRRNSHAEGITTDGDSLWVVDKDRDKVFRYSTDMSGILLRSFHVLPVTHPEGIATDGTNIWVVDKNTKKMYRFDVATLPPSETRVANGLVVLYDFEEPGGNTVNDVSGVRAPLNLTIQNPSRVSRDDGAISVNSSTIIQSSGQATKIISALKATNEITIEAWFKPDNTNQDGPARIVTLSKDIALRNFTLGQEDRTYDIRFRTTSTSTNGVPSLRTPNRSLTERLTHVVYTRSHTSGNTRAYINGVLVRSGNAPSSFSNWGETFRFALANELTLNRTWLGELHLVAIYDRDLTPNEVIQNFNAGP